MNANKKNNFTIPLTVPKNKRDLFEQNYAQATRQTGRFFLFAGDQKIEHLNQDFSGAGIPKECGYPEHLFKIAASAPIGVFATQLGLIARYGENYSSIPYLVKLNSKTNIVPVFQIDPVSNMLWSIQDVIEFKQSTGLNIVGVGYTVYLGSEYENIMLQEAAQLIYEAHSHGLITVLWMYPRGKAISKERDANLIAGAAGVGASLGADFVKINPPDATSYKESAAHLQQATKAAGNTGVLCSGGSKIDQITYLEHLYEQIHTGGTAGCAVGRNVHQLALSQAVNLCKAISSIVYDNRDVKTAQKLLE